MRLIVLGAAAGGGFPQWNADSASCRRARAGDVAAKPATQASVALTSDDRRYVLINASPDLRQQIEANPVLHPRDGLRSSPIAAVLLTNADVDAVAGLLSLREGTPFAIYAHAGTHAVLDRNPIFDVVSRALVPRRDVPLDQAFDLADADGAALGLRATAFAAPGKVPLWLEAEAGPALDTASEEGQALGLQFEAPGGRLVYLANCARVTPALRERLRGAATVLMDGTLWADDEMIAAGVGTKTGRRMGHIAMSGPDGAIAALADLGIARRIFIHVNNTNPALLADSPERQALTAAGWEVAHDGMEFEP